MKQFVLFFGHPWFHAHDITICRSIFVKLVNLPKRQLGCLMPQPRMKPDKPSLFWRRYHFGSTSSFFGARLELAAAERKKK